MLNKKTQNSRGNHLSESSKFAILDPQRMRVTNNHLFHFAKTAKLSTFHWVLQQKKHDVQLTRFYTRDFQQRISVCKNILKKQWKINKKLHLQQTIIFVYVCNNDKF